MNDNFGPRFDQALIKGPRPVGWLTLLIVSSLACAGLMLLGWSYGLSTKEIWSIALLEPVIHISLHVANSRDKQRRK